MSGGMVHSTKGVFVDDASRMPRLSKPPFRDDRRVQQRR
jgi:hypothetical protein